MRPDGVREVVRLPAALRALPRRLSSRLMGALTGIEAPPFLLRPLLRLYARFYGADLSEASIPVGGFRSFRAFFTRGLAQGRRPLPEDLESIVSPCDGSVVAAGPIVDGTLLQAKGVPYSLAELLGDAHAAERLRGGTFLTAYLAPGDYHRFHWPLDGRLTSARHIPGDLWPVNAGAVAGVPRLFVRNERVALLGETLAGAAFAIVPVGALHVGSIRISALPRLRTNHGAPARTRVFTPLDIPGRRGAELGWFEMGSSIVLLLAPEAGRIDEHAAGARLRTGERIGG